MNLSSSSTIYRDAICPLLKAWSHPTVLSRIKDSLVLFQPDVSSPSISFHSSFSEYDCTHRSSHLSSNIPHIPSPLSSRYSGRSTSRPSRKPRSSILAWSRLYRCWNERSTLLTPATLPSFPDRSWTVLGCHSACCTMDSQLSRMHSSLTDLCSAPTLLCAGLAGRS